MLDASRQMVSTHLAWEKKIMKWKYVHVNDWERSRKELLIAHSLFVMSYFVQVTVWSYHWSLILNCNESSFICLFVCFSATYIWLFLQWLAHLESVKNFRFAAWSLKVNKTWNLTIFYFLNSGYWLQISHIEHIFLLSIHHISIFAVVLLHIV